MACKIIKIGNKFKANGIKNLKKFFLREGNKISIYNYFIYIHGKNFWEKILFAPIPLHKTFYKECLALYII